MRRALFLKIYLSLLLWIFFRGGGLAEAKTVVQGGDITKDTRWTKQMSPILVKGNITVKSGAKLTIEPGVLVEFDGSFHIAVEGVVEAVGMAKEQIIFNGVLVPSSPPLYKTWGGFRLKSGGKLTLKYVKIIEASTSIFNTGGVLQLSYSSIKDSHYNCLFLRGGQNNVFKTKIYKCGRSGVVIEGGKTTISYSLIFRNDRYGVYIAFINFHSGNSVLMDHNTIVFNRKYGVYTDINLFSSNQVVLQNSILSYNGGNSYFGVELYNKDYGIICKKNLIWDKTGEFIYEKKTPKCKDYRNYRPLFVDPAKDDFRIYDRSPARKSATDGSDLGAFPWSGHKTNLLYGMIFSNLVLKAGIHRVSGDLFITKGASITLSPGAVLLFGKDLLQGGEHQNSIEIQVYGKLISSGTPVQRVVFKPDPKERLSWDRIEVHPGGVVDMKYTSLLSSKRALVNYGSSKLSDIEITNCFRACLYLLGGTFSLTRAKISGGASGIYFKGGVASISYTAIYRNRGSGVIIFILRGAHSLTLDHLTIAYNKKNGIYAYINSFAAKSKVLLSNSIVVRNYSPGYSYSEIYVDNVDITCKNNLIWDVFLPYVKGSPSNPSVSCKPMIKKDPLFVDEAKNDYRLKANSPARNRATDGTDLGAFPFKPKLVYILVSPSPALVEVGKSIQLKAQGLDNYGKSIPNLNFRWRVVNGGGTISNTGLFRAGTKAGTFVGTVEVTSGNIKGSATVVVRPGPTAKVSVTPTYAKLQVGEKANFKAQVFDKYGNSISGKSVLWNSSPKAGTISSRGEFTAGTKAGIYQKAVSATVDGVKGYATVELVAGPLNKIVIKPNPARVKAGGKVQFSAEGFDQYGNLIKNLKFTWKVVNGGGTIDQNGLLSAGSKDGTFRNTVEASAQNVKGYATLIVEPPPPKIVKVVISPSGAKLKPGETQTFRASAKDSRGKTVYGQSFKWKLLNGGGTLSISGGLHTRAKFTAGSKPGIYTLQAETSGVIGKAKIEVLPSGAGKLAEIRVSPKSATVKVGRTQKFRARGYDSSGTPVTNFSVKWSVSGGGTIDSSGLFRAGNQPGSYTVTASSGNIKGTAKVLVSAGKAPSIPRLKAPSDGVEVKSSQPTLEIYNSSDPDGDRLTYYFEVAEDSNFNIISVRGTASQQRRVTKWKVTKKLTEDQSYYWRVRAYDGTLYSGWSKPWKFTVNAVNGAPTAPKLSAPIDGGEVSTRQPTLEVRNAKDPEGKELVYKFLVSSDRSFKQVVASSPPVKEGKNGVTSWKVSTVLKDGSVYYWQAWAIDVEGLAGPKMRVARFKVSLANSPPSLPKPRRPKNGETVKTLRPSFEVDNSVDPDGQPVTLDIEIDVKKSFDSPEKQGVQGLIQHSSGVTTWVPNRDLAENSIYFWRVRASDGKTVTAWVFAGQFLVNSKNDPPTAPKPKLPADKTTVPLGKVLLEVFNASDPDGDKLTYEFQVSEKSDFSKIDFSARNIPQGKGSTAFEITVNEGGKTYYWRARASDGIDTGLWSDIYSFTVEFTPAENSLRERGGGESPGKDAEEKFSPEERGDVSELNAGHETFRRDGGVSSVEAGTGGELLSENTGCGCSLGGGSLSFFFSLLLVGLGAVYRRRR